VLVVELVAKAAPRTPQAAPRPGAVPAALIRGGAEQTFITGCIRTSRGEPLVTTPLNLAAAAVNLRRFSAAPPS